MPSGFLGRIPRCLSRQVSRSLCESCEDAYWRASAKIVMTLNRGLYDQVRDLIHQKLNDANKLHLLVPLCKCYSFLMLYLLLNSDRIFGRGIDAYEAMNVESS